MAKTQSKDKTPERVSAQPRLHQRADEIQAYDTVSHLLPLDLEEPGAVGNDCPAQSTGRRYYDAP